MKKYLIYRLAAAFLLLLYLAMPIAFVIDCFKNVNVGETMTLSIIGLFVLLFFAGVEIALLLFQPSREPSIEGIVWNENKTLNKGPMIIVSVALGASLALLAVFAWLYLVSDGERHFESEFLLSFFAFIALNTALYLAYIPLSRKKKVTLKDLSF